MAEQLLIHVPRYVEREPGYRSTELVRDPTALKASASVESEVMPAVPQAVYEPVSGRWLSAPRVDLSTEDDLDYLLSLDGGVEWTGEIVAVSPPDAGGGAQVVAGGSDETPWVLRRMVDVTCGAGYYIDLFFFPPDDPDAVVRQQFTLEWGGADADAAARFRLTLTSSGQLSGHAVIEESIGTVDEPKWRAQVVYLLDGAFYGQQHRLWLQPLSGNEFLIANRDKPERGLTMVAAQPFAYAPDAEQADQTIFAPWGASTFRLRGVSRAWMVVRELAYESDWTVETIAPRWLGYGSTQPVTAEAIVFRPDQQPEETSLYSVTLQVFQSELDGTPWPAEVFDEPEQYFAFRMTVAGPEDAGTGLSRRAVVLDRLELDFAKTIESDESLPFDLMSAGVIVLLAGSLREERARRDWDSRLSFAIHGPFDELQAIAVSPNARVQWIVDETYYDPDLEVYSVREVIRFDGLVDRVRDAPWPTTAGDWIDAIQVSCRTRFKQAAEVLYKGGIGLDGQLRSFAYEELARQLPLKVDWTAEEEAWSPELRPALEFEAAELPDDNPLPEALPGERPALLPRIGTSLLRVMQDVREAWGPRDRLRFCERDGSIKLYVDQPSATSLATFYHTTEDATASGWPARFLHGPVKHQAWEQEQDDSTFYNEIIVVGGEDAQGNLLSAFWMDPSSWTEPYLPGTVTRNPLYIGVRRTVIVIRPEIHREADLVWALYALVAEFYRVRWGGAFTSFFVPSLYPLDRVTLDAGTRPDGLDIDYELEGMTTIARPGVLQTDERYITTYGVRAV